MTPPTSDGQSDLSTYFGTTFQDTSSEQTTELVKRLKARGGQEQLILFLPGFAGAGKSTCLKIAQRFCFEFCRAVSIEWDDNTFLFTATTGSAMEEPSPHFVDRTEDYLRFWDNIRQCDFKGMQRALDPMRLIETQDQKPMVIPDVLCPWGCCEFAFRYLTPQ